MKKIHIEINEYWSDCEDCGYYKTAYGKVFVDSVKTLDFVYDGHLGASTWASDLSTVYIWCLELLGVKTVLLEDSKPVQVLGYSENIYDRGFREVVQKPLLNEEKETICLSYYYSENSTRYVVELKTATSCKEFVKELDADGVALKNTWTGDICSLLKEQLEHRCVLTQDLTIESDESFIDED